jgi:sorbitol-specific phosphotransferase system component IIA
VSLRELIYAVADDLEGVGPLEETLKWGEISYLNPAGTTLRIGTPKGNAEQVAIFVHCGTKVVHTLKERGCDTLRFDGNRCIRLPDGNLDQPDVVRAIEEILTYKLN